MEPSESYFGIVDIACLEPGRFQLSRKIGFVVAEIFVNTGKTRRVINEHQFYSSAVVALGQAMESAHAQTS